MTRRDALLAAGVAGAAAVWAWPALEGGYEGPYDEGLSLCAAWRALGGEALYRDVWSLHPPGTAWLLAGLFRSFGTSLAVERAAKLAVLAGCAFLVFLLARLVARPWAAAGAALLFVALPTQTLSLRPRDTGLLLVLAALAAASARSRRPWLQALVAGLLAGLTVWFKQDFALAAVLAGGTALLGEGTLFPFAAGVVVGPAALAATLAAQGTFDEFVKQVIVFPVFSFGSVRSLPLSLRFEQLSDAVSSGIPSNGLLDVAAVPFLFLVALVAASASAAGGARAFRRGAGGGAAPSRVLLASSVACLLLLAAPFQRADLEHLNPPLALALVALAAAAAPLGPERATRIATFIGFSLASLVLLFSAPVALDRGRLFEARLRGGHAAGATGLAAAPRWVGLPTDVAEAARLVARETRPGERIFVGNARHDALAYGAPLVSFLSGRMGATRYDNLHPGVVTTRAVQEEIVRELEARRVRVLVLWDGPPLVEPNASSVPSGVSVLDDWIAAKTSEVARVGAYRVMRAREPGATPAPRP